MKIFFTKKQYEALMKMAYLGSWLANACKTGDDRDMEIESIEEYIFSFAKDFGMEEHVEQNEDKKGKVYPTRDFEEMMSEYIDDYNEENFWDELVHSLSGRDFLEHYGKESIEKMEMSERFANEQTFIDKYEDEFYDNGVQNLRIKGEF